MQGEKERLADIDDIVKIGERGRKYKGRKRFKNYR